ncbi:IS5 family transposase [Tritonibacter scottomollicae]|uniref:IS5 family transposase n=1 Tax=Tritonibacter scottomollicae TaxID=483013 RepID=A0ABZ0HM91_TRISK|nr:IS5 family transposase [Tritonibacter scottomollicae]WOI35269.1 IS5 family transposase [Tritonibacter scottomollicae]
MGRTKGGMNTKLHAICDSQGRPINLFVTAGQVSDYIGARALVSSLPDAEWLLGDRGYDADWFREALEDKGIRACIPGRKQRKTPVKYDKRRYKRRNRTEIMFGRLKDWRRFATRYDRCPKVFLSAIALAATVIFWLCVLTLSWMASLEGVQEVTSLSGELDALVRCIVQDVAALTRLNDKIGASDLIASSSSNVVLRVVR